MMIEEDKKLLLKDLCARLPYGIKVHYQEEICSIDCICHDGRILLIDKYGTQLPNIGDNLFEDINEIKLYLRSMSSMTEEEKEGYNNTRSDYYDDLETYDWLNARHFDYRGLIEKGLALEATTDMYNN